MILAISGVQVDQNQQTALLWAFLPASKTYCMGFQVFAHKAALAYSPPDQNLNQTRVRQAIAWCIIMALHKSHNKTTPCLVKQVARKYGLQ